MLRQIQIGDPATTKDRVIPEQLRKRLSQVTSRTGKNAFTERKLGSELGPNLDHDVNEVSVGMCDGGGCCRAGLPDFSVADGRHSREFVGSQVKRRIFQKRTVLARL